MNPEVRFSVADRLRSFRHALRGLWVLIQSQHNARMHLLAAVCVIAAGVSLRLSITDWCLTALSITVVWVSEALNTAVESLVDLASPEMHPLAGRAKDIAAGAVLLSAIGAVFVGALVFLPRVPELFSN